MRPSGRLGHEGLPRMHEFLLRPGGRRLAAGSPVVLTVPLALVLSQTFRGGGPPFETRSS